MMNKKKGRVLKREYQLNPASSIRTKKIRLFFHIATLLGTHLSWLNELHLKSFIWWHRISFGNFIIQFVSKIDTSQHATPAVSGFKRVVENHRNNNWRYRLCLSGFKWSYHQVISSHNESFQLMQLCSDDFHLCRHTADIAIVYRKSFSICSTPHFLESQYLNISVSEFPSHVDYLQGWINLVTSTIKTEMI